MLVTLFMSLIVGGSFCALVYRHRLGRREAARDQALGTIQTLATEFPDIVRAWGGETVLLNHEMVKQIGRYSSEIHYYDHHATEQSRPETVREDRQVTGIGVVIGVSIGLVVAGLVTLLLFQRSWYRWQAIWGAALGAVLGGGVGVGIGALHEVFQGPYWSWVDRDENGVQTGQWRQGYFDKHGDRLDTVHYRLLERKSMTSSILLGGCAGVPILIAVLLLSQRWYGAQAARARKEANEEAQKVAGDFPQVAAAPGGIEGLTRADNVQEVILQLEGGTRE
jgi:hypothetical protein